MNIELLEEPKTTELTVTARAALALSSDKARKELQALVAKSANIKEVKNIAGRDECHGAAMTLVRARTTIEKTGKAARDDATKFSKAVIAEEKSLIEITAGEESRLLALRDAWDAARAAEKAEAERIERLRIETIHLRIADIREAGNLALQCRTSAEVEILIDKLDGTTLEGFDEFAEEAERARETTITRMKEISEAKRAEEQERARIKAEQEAEAARLAAERAELERQRKEAAEAERIAAQERVAQEVKAKAARDAEEAVAKAVRDAEAKRLADERAAFEAEQSAARAAMQAEADRVAAERAAWQAEVDRRAAEAKALEVPAEPIIESNPIFNQEDGGDVLSFTPNGSDDDEPIDDIDIANTAILAIVEKFGMEWSEAADRLQAIEDWSTADLSF